ncbi:MAG: hypothetical protein HF962_01720 [Sulfurovum sp.]|nr:hypothetical protein [Sulfurovum sp.]
MKEIVEYFGKKGIVFKSLKTIKVKDLGSRKKVDIYLGVNIKEYFVMLLNIEKKSRILKKEVNELIELHLKLESFIGSKIVKKYILIKAPLCSKAKVMLEENGWKVELPA